MRRLICLAVLLVMLNGDCMAMWHQSPYSYNSYRKPASLNNFDNRPSYRAPYNYGSATNMNYGSRHMGYGAENSGTFPRYLNNREGNLGYASINSNCDADDVRAPIRKLRRFLGRKDEPVTTASTATAATDAPSATECVPEESVVSNESVTEAVTESQTSTTASDMNAGGAGGGEDTSGGGGDTGSGGGDTGGGGGDTGGGGGDTGGGGGDTGGGGGDTGGGGGGGAGGGGSSTGGDGSGGMSPPPTIPPPIIPPPTIPPPTIPPPTIPPPPIQPPPIQPPTIQPPTIQPPPIPPPPAAGGTGDDMGGDAAGDDNNEAKAKELHRLIQHLYVAQARVQLEATEIRKAQAIANAAQQQLEEAANHVRAIAAAMATAQQEVASSAIRAQTAQLQLAAHDQLLFAARQDVDALSSQVVGLQAAEGLIPPKLSFDLNTLLEKLKQPLADSQKPTEIPRIVPMPSIPGHPGGGVDKGKQNPEHPKFYQYRFQ